MRPSNVTELPTRAAQPQAEPTVAAYDFRRPSKLSRDHVRALQMAYETFARRLTTVLTSGLRQVCEVRLGDITQQSYDEYVTSLASPTLMVPLEIEPLGSGALEMSLPAAFAAFDHMLGGPGGTQPVRNLTDIETTVFRGLVEQILGVLAYAFESTVAITIEAGAIEYSPQFLQVASAADPVVIARFDLVVGRESSHLTLCLPLGRLLPRLAGRPRETAAETLGAAHPLLRERLSDLPVGLEVRFATTTVDSAVVLGLSVGDVLPLDHRVGDPLTVLAGGAPVAHAVAGRSGSRLVALVVDNDPTPTRRTDDQHVAHGPGRHARGRRRRGRQRVDHRRIDHVHRSGRR